MSSADTYRAKDFRLPNGVPKVDTGLPDNCAGTPFGWMVIPASGKTMAAVVLGLKLRGDLSQTGVYVYTTAPASPGGYCQVTQIDPVG